MKNLRIVSYTQRQQNIVKATFTGFTSQILCNRLATHLLEQEVSLRHIHTLLGHGNSKTTEIHTSVSTKSLANIKRPLDPLLEIQKSEKQTITNIKT